MENKYELTDEVIEYLGHTLHRIKALKDFGDIKKGDMGGWIEGSFNLSQYGNCWVYQGAIAYDNSRVLNNSKIYDNAQIYGNAWIWENAKVYGNARVGGYTMIFGKVNVCDDALVCGDSIITDEAKICGKITISNNPMINGNPIISKIGDYAVFQDIWGNGDYITWTKSNNMWKEGSFYGTEEELIKKSYKVGKNKGKRIEKLINFIKDYYV